MAAKKKQPAIQWYVGDWLKDPEVSMCSPATRGIWVDILCAMHERDRTGMISGTVEQLARVARCSAPEMQLAIAEISSTKVGEVTVANGIITVINRRMHREYKERKSNAYRQKRHKENSNEESNGENNGEVTEKSRPRTTSSSSSSSSDNPPNPPSGEGSVGCSFEKISKAELADPEMVRRWIDRNLPQPVSEDLRLKVHACTLRALAVGRSPPKLFRHLVELGLKEGEWQINDDEILAASRLFQPQRNKNGQGSGPESIGDILKGDS